jgi:hypothetical protein
VVVGIGAWWAWHRPHQEAAFDAALSHLVATVDRLFSARPTHRAAYFGDGQHGLWQRHVHKVFAAAPNCANASDSAALNIAKLNDVARKRLRADAPHWSYFDRELLTRTTCDPAADCAGVAFTARFHPVGRPLNVLVHMLLERVLRRLNNGTLSA